MKPRLASNVKRLVKSVGLRRSHVASLRLCCERTAIAALGPKLSQDRPRILCYHSVGTQQWGVNDVRPAQFRRHLELALAAGYRFVPAEEIARTGGATRQLAVTFDDGLQSVIKNAAPILAELQIPWTLFIVSDWADGKHAWGDGVLLGWREIERLAARGVTIGSHSVSHPNFADLPADVTCYELLESRRVISSRLGIPVTSFAIPMGQARDWTQDAQAAAREAGYETIYAQSADHRASGTVARTFITRFDNDRIFRAALRGGFDGWEEWV